MPLYSNPVWHHKCCVYGVMLHRIPNQNESPNKTRLARCGLCGHIQTRVNLPGTCYRIDCNGVLYRVPKYRQSMVSGKLVRVKSDDISARVTDRQTDQTDVKISGRTGEYQTNLSERDGIVLRDKLQPAFGRI